MNCNISSRFRYCKDHNGHLRALKLDKSVEYRLSDLDLRPFMSGHVNADNEPTFDLYGVVNHSGNAFGGHYTSYSRHPVTGEWNYYNDRWITAGQTPNSNDTDASEAYTLFYERRGT